MILTTALLAALLACAPPLQNTSSTTLPDSPQPQEQHHKHRVLGVVPSNGLASASAKFTPLTPREKFKVFADDTLDPFTLVSAAIDAGIGQAVDDHHGYGQGAEGFAKRFGASTGDIVTGNFFRTYAFPTLLHQDPRYFKLGPSSTSGHRFNYALSRVLITRGDNGNQQFNFSNVLGSFASAGVSNFYYPSNERGLGLTAERAAVGLAVQSGFNVLAEFSDELLHSFIRHKK